jgi:hypothetical protein
MKTLLRLEDAAIAVFATVLFLMTGFAWWWLGVLFLVPDVSMVGYAAGPRVGAAVYNVVHHRAIAVGIYCLGVLLRQPVLLAAGSLLLFHSSVDRVLGYGLKYPDSFGDTHLGRSGGNSASGSDD